MKFLSKLFEYFAKGVAIFQGFAPIIQQAAPQSGVILQTVSKDLSTVLDITTDVEKISAAATAPLTGDQKLAIAVPLVADVYLKSSALAGHSVANPALFNQGVSKVASGSADIVNSLKTDGIDKLVTVKT